MIVSLYKKQRINYEKAIEAIKIIDEEGWFESYIIDKSKEDLKDVRS
ncbi:hypothetical protein J4216_01510 [Candidatus Woesearchaeota archaeon]|nr:hypothetical protein [Candidatus Woesearchaeota archaeon]